MFLAHVLCGKVYDYGLILDKELRRPPCITGTTKLYDSVKVCMNDGMMMMLELAQVSTSICTHRNCLFFFSAFVSYTTGWTAPRLPDPRRVLDCPELSNVHFDVQKACNIEVLVCLVFVTMEAIVEWRMTRLLTQITCGS